MDKEINLRQESDNLGDVIKHLIEFDAKQRGEIADELSQRDKSRSELAAQKAEIEEKHMNQAKIWLEALEEKQKQKEEREIQKAVEAAEKNIAELEKTAGEKSEFWIDQIFNRTVGK